MNRSIFFDNWEGIIRLLIISPIAYISVLLFLRLFGNRTLAKLNAFDFVITVALGSSLATVVLSKSVPLAEGVLAIGLLIVFQFIAALIIERSRVCQRLLTGEPRLLFHRGEFLPEAMQECRITESDICSAVRGSGLGDLEAIEAVVLETDGELSVVGKATVTTGSSLDDVVKV